MKLFIDTNVIIDVIAKRDDFLEDSQFIMTLCESGKAEGSISTLTFCTAAYILRKQCTTAKMRDKLRNLKSIVKPIDLSASIVEKAIDSNLTDFEDAIQFFSAVYCGADYIITRNVKDFKQDNIPVLTPSDFRTLMEHQA